MLFFPKKIRNPCHLDFFQRRIDRFIPKNDLEAECLALSQAFYTLWQDFPNHSIYTHLHRAEGYEQGEEELFEVEKYLSFVYEDQSDLFHTYLLDWLNGEYSQCSEIELPTITNISTVQHPLLTLILNSVSFLS